MERSASSARYQAVAVDSRSRGSAQPGVTYLDLGNNVEVRPRARATRAPRAVPARPRERTRWLAHALCDGLGLPWVGVRGYDPAPRRIEARRTMAFGYIEARIRSEDTLSRLTRLLAMLPSWMTEPPTRSFRNPAPRRTRPLDSPAPPRTPPLDSPPPPGPRTDRTRIRPATRSSVPERVDEFLRTGLIAHVGLHRRRRAARDPSCSLRGRPLYLHGSPGTPRFVSARRRSAASARHQDRDYRIEDRADHSANLSKRRRIRPAAARFEDLAEKRRILDGHEARYFPGRLASTDSPGALDTSKADLDGRQSDPAKSARNREPMSPLPRICYSSISV